MRKKRLNKTLGVLLAVLLPLTIIGAAILVFLLPQQNINWDWHTIEDNYSFSTNNFKRGRRFKDSESKVLTLDDSYNDIYEIDITDLVENVIIEQSENNTTTIAYNGNNDLRVIEADGTLKIYDKKYNDRKINFGSKFNNPSSLTITLGKSVQDIEVDLPVTDFKMYNITTEKLAIDAGVGNIEITDTIVKTALDIDGGVGRIHITDSQLADAEINSGVGETTLINVTAQLLEIENGLGSVSITDSTIDTLSTDSGIGNVDIKNSTIKNRDKN